MVWRTGDWTAGGFGGAPPAIGELLAWIPRDPPVEHAESASHASLILLFGMHPPPGSQPRREVAHSAVDADRQQKGRSPFPRNEVCARNWRVVLSRPGGLINHQAAFVVTPANLNTTV